MCGSMVDIQSPTAEIRRLGEEKKKKKEEEEERRKKPQSNNGLPITQGGHNKLLYQRKKTKY